MRLTASILEQWSIEFGLPVLELLRLIEIHERTNQVFTRGRSFQGWLFGLFRAPEDFVFCMHKNLKQFDEALRERWDSLQPLDRWCIGGKRSLPSGIEFEDRGHVFRFAEDDPIWNHTYEKFEEEYPHIAILQRASWAHGGWEE